MMNLIDKALLPFDPQRVAHRVKARAQVQAFDMAASSGTPGAGGGTSGSGAGSRWWNPFARSAARDTLQHLGTQRGASRELTRTNAIAAGAINTSVDRIIGTGLAYVASPARHVLGWSADQADEWKAKAQAEFSLWADDPLACDLTGEQTFYQAQATAVRGTKESGDIFSLLPTAVHTDLMDYPDAQTYVAGLRERGWRVKGVAVLGQDGGGVRAPNLRQYIQAPTAPVNLTARDVRAQFGWV
jgi:capsid protein